MKGNNMNEPAKNGGSVCGIPKKVEEGQPEDNQVQGDSIQQRMSDLLAGKAEPENEFVEYALGKMRECGAEKAQLLEQHQKAKEAIAMMERRLIAVTAEYQKYGDDIANFDSVLKAMEVKR